MSDSSKPAILLAPLEGLPPLLSPDIHTIILGSFPSRESLAASQYYAHPRNQFWRLLSEVLTDDLAQQPYEDRLPRLLTHKIGLWDVISMCEREGSLDSRIKHAVANDFDLLKKECLKLKNLLQRQVAGLTLNGFPAPVLNTSAPLFLTCLRQPLFEDKLAI